MIKGRSDLQNAVISGNAESVRALLARGAPAGEADAEGWTALHFAAASYRADLAQLLLAAGAHVDPQDMYGNTPLWRAVFESRGRGDVIVLLRRHGANEGMANKSGVTPLALAQRIANYDVMQYFR